MRARNLRFDPKADLYSLSVIFAEARSWAGCLRTLAPRAGCQQGQRLRLGIRAAAGGRRRAVTCTVPTNADVAGGGGRPAAVRQAHVPDRRRPHVRCGLTLPGRAVGPAHHTAASRGEGHATINRRNAPLRPPPLPCSCKVVTLLRYTVRNLLRLHHYGSALEPRCRRPLPVHCLRALPAARWLLLCFDYVLRRIPPAGKTAPLAEPRPRRPTTPPSPTHTTLPPAGHLAGRLGAAAGLPRLPLHPPPGRAPVAGPSLPAPH